MATGSTPKMLNMFNGIDNVYTAQDILLGKHEVENSATIVGGGLVGCETALWLAKKGKKVNIIECLDDILASGPPMCHANSQMLKDLLKFYNVNIETKATISNVDKNKITVNKNGIEKEICSDTIIVSVGYLSNKELYDELRFNNKETYLLGDALEVRNIISAIWDAFEVARNI